MICLLGNPRVKGQVRDVGGRGPWYPLSFKVVRMCKSYTVADGRPSGSAIVIHQPFTMVDLQQGATKRQLCVPEDIGSQPAPL